MQILKTYEQVDSTNESINFRINRMEDHYEGRNGEQDVPHRHNYYTVILSTSAKGKHLIDFNEYSLTGKQVHFVSPGQMHQVLEYEKSFGYVLVFSSEFLVVNHIPFSFIEDLNLFNDYGQSPPLDVDDEKMRILSSYCEEIIKWNSSELKFKEYSIGALLKLFLVECNNLCTLEKRHDQVIEAGNTILKKFKALVNENYAVWHSTSEYAQKLNISADHLNRTVKILIGKTAKEYIQSRIIIAAKRMLYFSELSTKEIGYELGFQEASNFSAFFKKNTLKSPSQFRANQ